MADAPICNVHEQEMTVMHEIRTSLAGINSDVKWLMRIGSRWMTVIGGALIILIPVLISFFVYISRVESRLSIVEYKLTQLTDQKHAEGK